MGDSHDTMGSDDASLHDVHVLPSYGVIQAEELGIGGGYLKGAQLCHGAPPLMGYVVDDQQTAGICHLPIVPVVSLQHGQACHKQHMLVPSLYISCKVGVVGEGGGAGLAMSLLMVLCDEPGA